MVNAQTSTVSVAWAAAGAASGIGVEFALVG